MIASTLVLLSLLAVAVAIVPIDIGPIHPIDPIPPIWPPWNRPCNCARVHCPKGYHCEMIQHIVCVKAPCNFPKEPTCVPNKVPIG